MIHQLLIIVYKFIEQEDYRKIYLLINIKRKNEYETNNYYTLLSDLTG